MGPGDPDGDFDEQLFGAWHRLHDGTDPFDERRILILTRRLERGAPGKAVPLLPLGS